jgi:hypothetical protein
VSPFTVVRAWGRRWFWPIGTLLLLLVAAGLTGQAESPAQRRPPPDSPRPLTHPGDQLMQQLALADRQWWPRAEPLPGGGTRYVYRRRPGEPELTLDGIKALMRHPPTFAQERQRIVQLRRALLGLGVGVELSQPHKPGAAAEWDPSARTIRLKPAVVAKGSAEFLRVLNHEAIHVAQSCRGGGIGAAPQPLGLSQQLPAHLQAVLQDPTYASASVHERQLEREAYAHQEQLDLGLSLLSLYC